MDKKDGGPIDLESLRGFTPGPWRWWTSCSFDRLSSDETGKDGDVLYATKYRDGVCGIEGTVENKRLIAAAPSMHAELTTRRARDAEVGALVAALREAMAWNWLDEDASPSTVADQCEKALAPFTGDKT